MEKKTSMERSEAAKKLRESKKYGKKVRQGWIDRLKFDSD